MKSWRGKVAVLKTRPETVVEDYARLMQMAGFQDILSPDRVTILKNNISWHTWYPACSTTPWQYEGVIKALLDAGHPRENVIPAYNRTVVVDDKVGMVNNKFTVVEEKYGLGRIHLYEPPIEWNPACTRMVIESVRALLQASMARLRQARRAEPNCES